MKRFLVRGQRGGAGAGTGDAPASSIFLMISQLYTLLAHLRSLGRDGTSCSTSSYLTEGGDGEGGGFVSEKSSTLRREDDFFGIVEVGRRRAIAPPGRRCRSIGAKRRVRSEDHELIDRLARPRRPDRGSTSWAAPPKPATLWGRKVGRKTIGRTSEKMGVRPDTHRQPPGSTSPPAGVRSSAR